MRFMETITDDILNLIHEFIAHPCLTNDDQGCLHHNHNCPCALGCANRHLRSLFQHVLKRMFILVPNIPVVDAARTRVRELELLGWRTMPDADWSMLRYLQDATRLRRLTVLCERGTFLKAFHLDRLADLLRTLPRYGVPTICMYVCPDTPTAVPLHRRIHRDANAGTHRTAGLPAVDDNGPSIIDACPSAVAFGHRVLLRGRQRRRNGGRRRRGGGEHYSHHHQKEDGDG